MEFIFQSGSFVELGGKEGMPQVSLVQRGNVPHVAGFERGPYDAVAIYGPHVAGFERG